MGKILIKSLAIGLVLLLFAPAIFAQNMPAADVEYKRIELSRLGMPGDAPNSYETWQKLIALACEYEDDEIAERLLTKKNFPLDGFFATNYDLLIASFLIKNPRLFFKHALKGIGSVEKIADSLINETEEVQFVQLEKALKEIPKNKQSPYQVAFLRAAKKKNQKLHPPSKKINRPSKTKQ